MSKSSSLLYLSLALTILLYVLHLLAVEHYLYWYYWWFDYMMHFLAGLASGLAVYWVLFGSGLWRRQADKVLLPILSVLISLIIAGVWWEVFEYVNGITDSHEGYRLDITHDLIMDSLGALVAALIGVRQTLLRKSSAKSLNG
jgi:hypothetical protein